MATKKPKADQPTSAVQPGEYDFDKFVSYGIAAGANVVNGMPWSFKFGDYPVTHENDNLYLIAYDNETIRFARGDTLDVSDLGIVHRQASADAEDPMPAIAPKDAPNYMVIYKDHNDVEVYGAMHDERKGHDYIIGVKDKGALLGIEFQNGPIKEVGINGVQTEHLLAILIHRTKILNERFPCAENELAIRYMKLGINALQARTANRIERGVEGQSAA